MSISRIPLLMALVVACFTSSLSSTATAVDASSAACAGFEATIVVDHQSSHTVRGTNGSDVILVQEAGHHVIAAGGDDLVCGSAGVDTVSGGAGADVVYAGGGADHVSGGVSQDRLHGEAGADVLRGGGGVDVVFAGEGEDRVFGQAGADLLVDAIASGHLSGNAGNDDCLVGDQVVECDDADTGDLGVSAATEAYLDLILIG